MNQNLDTTQKQELAQNWFRNLRDQIRESFEDIEAEYAADNNLSAGKFEVKKWDRAQGGGGEMSIMKGNVFEKIGVNISTVHGEFSEEFKSNIPGTENSANFWASGISLVAHMQSPLVPAVHMNTRFICTEKTWFGGGADLTPIIEKAEDTEFFHQAFKDCCDKHDKSYYPEFKKKCDEYFFLKHRNEARGIGGIFYDYHNTENWQDDFELTQDVGKTFLKTYVDLVKKHMNKDWSDEQRQQQLVKRGRYVEFNLLYDRGTKFGLMTNGNTEAILMSMPPEVKWP